MYHTQYYRENTHTQVLNDDIGIITFFLPRKYDLSFLETEWFFLTARERRETQCTRLLELLALEELGPLVGGGQRRERLTFSVYVLYSFIHSFIPPIFIECLLCA